MHYYQHNIGDYRRDTAHLSLLEHGIYRALLDTYYLDEKPLCSDHAKLMRSHCVRTADEQRALENVLSDFFVLTEKGYEHARCDKEISRFKGKSDKASASASARWQKKAVDNQGRDANALRTHCDGNANHKPITNNQEPRTNKNIDADKPRAPAALSLLMDNGISEQTARDFLSVRKAKRAPLTETALGGIKREAEKAGWPLEAALRECVIRGWQGFKAEWVNKPCAANNNTKPSYDDGRKRDYGEGGLI